MLMSALSHATVLSPSHLTWEFATPYLCSPGPHWSVANNVPDHVLLWSCGLQADIVTAECQQSLSTKCVVAATSSTPTPTPLDTSGHLPRTSTAQCCRCQIRTYSSKLTSKRLPLGVSIKDSRHRESSHGCYIIGLDDSRGLNLTLSGP